MNITSSTLKMRKSHKKLACVYAYTHAYTPPELNRVKKRTKDKNLNVFAVMNFSIILMIEAPLL